MISEYIWILVSKGRKYRVKAIDSSCDLATADEAMIEQLFKGNPATYNAKKALSIAHAEDKRSDVSVGIRIHYTQHDWKDETERAE